MENKYSKYHSKNKIYRNAWKKLKYKLDKGKIDIIEFNRLVSELKQEHSIGGGGA